MSELPQKMCVGEVAHLPYDLVFKILLLLPAKDLRRLISVCKTWYKLINSSNFVEAHIHRCETVLAFLRPISEIRPHTFSLESNLGQFSLFERSSSQKRRFYIHFLELQDGKANISDPNICDFGDILATCNGLILATNKNGDFRVMNPTTKKLIGLRLGTIVGPHDESYGFVFSHHTSEYKVVHLFRDKLGHIDCEILSLTTRSWRAVDGPSFGLFSDFKHKAVTASGVLYWLPGKDNVTDLIYMDMKDEKFVTRALPIVSSTNDRLVEIGGVVSFVSHVTVYRMQLWILKRNQCGDDWVKQYTINMDYDIKAFVPVFATRNSRYMVLKRERASFYTYDFNEEELKEVEFDTERSISYDELFIPHVDSLASWVNVGPLW